MVVVLAIGACEPEPQQAVPGSSPTTGGSETLEVPPGGIGVAAADLVLPAEMFGELWVNFHVEQDLGADGSDDVVSLFIERLDMFYEDSTRTAYGIWPDVLQGAPMWPITSPRDAENDGEGDRHEGVTRLLSTADVTDDGQRDLWIRDWRSTTMLVPGPRDTGLLDPSGPSVASLWGTTPCRPTSITTVSAS
jgi:hypothetical protein